MVNGEAILKELQDQMQISSKAFEELNKDIEATVQEYRDKLNELEQEGNAKIKQLYDRREQIRGEYTGLYNTFIKFSQLDETKANEDKQNKTTPVKEVKSKTKTTKKTEEPKDTSSLSPEEVEKLKAVTNKQPKQEDIPDYLKEEYAKQNKQ